MPSANGTAASTLAPYPTLARPATLDHLRAKPRPWRIVDVCLSVEAQEAAQETDTVLRGTKLALQAAEMKADEARKASEASGTPEDALVAAEAGKVAQRAQKALKEAEKANDAAQAAYVEAQVEILFVSVGRQAYAAMTEAVKAPETGESEEAAKERQEAQQGVHIALVAASCHSIDLTAEDVRDIFDTWNLQESERLLAAALEVNTTSRLVVLGRGNRGAAKGA